MLKNFFFSVLLLVLIPVANASCPMTDTRICGFVEKIEAFGSTTPVVYVESDVPAQATQSRWTGKGRDIMVLGDTTVLSDEALLFVLAHEYAHSQLRHSRKLLEALVPEQARALSDADLFQQYYALATPEAIDQHQALNYEQEFEADAFAAKVLRSLGMNPRSALSQVVTQQRDTPTHPSVKNRLKQLQQGTNT